MSKNRIEVSVATPAPPEENPRPAKAVKLERELDQLTRWTDNLIRVPVVGWRIGLDPIIGFFFPVVGDTATSLASLYILAAGVRYRVPKITMLRMGFNIAADYAVGSLPVVGDLFDAWWKSNQRNTDLLRRRATVSAEEARQGRTSDWLFVGLITLFLLGLLFGSIALTIYFWSLLIRNTFNQ
jgi:hypothetical protein